MLMQDLTPFSLVKVSPLPQPTFQGDAAHQPKRLAWLTLNDSPGTKYTQRDYLPLALRPFHRTVFTAHTWIALPDFGRNWLAKRILAHEQYVLDGIRFQVIVSGTVHGDALP